MQAHDPDFGLNGEVRYEILPGEGAQDAITRFTVDPSSGQVRTKRNIIGQMLILNQSTNSIYFGRIMHCFNNTKKQILKFSLENIS